MRRTTPELAPRLQTSTPHQREDIWLLGMIYCATGPIHNGFLVESGFEPGTLRPQSRDLTTRPTRPHTDVITLEYQSQNRLDFPTLAMECDRYGIPDRTATSFASAVPQGIGIVHEGEASHVVERNKIRRQRKKL
ncbi:hypothetical protein AVEN_72748-1 [Araneus ventricosus]|uniref:Uncharacterized protein n=1 Tax=Araneus ventricosus TaxID=182803 RepID=A0A4Y2DNR3_ARAVE|nr:hypothetical protein AVEN_72748-1 [Araneus ventricosus]